MIGKATAPLSKGRVLYCSHCTQVRHALHKSRHDESNFHVPHHSPAPAQGATQSAHCAASPMPLRIVISRFSLSSLMLTHRTEAHPS